MPINLPPEIIELRKTYQDSQKRLLEIIANQEATGTPTAYRKRILAGVNEELRILDKYANEWVNKNVVEAYKGAMIGTYQVYRDANITVPAVSFNTAVVKILTENAASKFIEAHNFVGRRIDDEIRKATVSVIAEKVSTGMTVKQVKQRLLESFSDNGIKAVKDKNGKQISLDAYAEMVGRTTTREATNQGTIDEMHSVRGDLVKMSQHFSSCPVCVVYEGRVYSISGNDKRFPALYETAFKGGYNTIHPNCTHSLLPIIEKYNDMDALQKESNRPFEIQESDKKSIDDYNKRQDKKREQRIARQKWEKPLVNDPTTPKTFAGYQSRQRALDKKKKNTKVNDEYKNITHDELEKITNDNYDSIANDKKDVIKNYTAAEYAPINNVLRGKQEAKNITGKRLEEINNQINIINSLKVKAPSNIIAYRGASLNAIGIKAREIDQINNLVNAEIIDKGFGSTTINRDIFNEIGNNELHKIEMIINIPKDSDIIPVDGMSIFAEEDEIIIPSNAKYKITSVNEGAEGKYIINMDYLGSD